MKEDICRAISFKQVIAFVYDDHPRVVEPYCLGMTNLNNTVLAAFQIQGSSRSGTIPNWRMFQLDRVKHLEVVPELRFEVRPDYNPHKNNIVDTFCAVNVH
ncbi:MAG: hypothetical protein KI790_08830 [Cyclobacteriaceae bacterium]|nr:hypothetical protein [Cyclobacteriaceae bacterium HetDA_MAG_MS6]